MCHLFETFRPRRRRRNMNRLMLQARARVRGRRLKIHICHLGCSSHHREKRYEPLRLPNKSIQLPFVLETRGAFPPDKNQKCIFTRPRRRGGARRSMTTQHLGSEGRKSLRPRKQTRGCYFLLLQDQIFGARCSQFPRGPLEGVVFASSVFSLR